MKTFLIYIILLLTVLGTSTASGNVNEEEFNVADEPFQRRFTVIEDFGRKSALIEIHLTSIDMLVSVTVNSVSKSVSSFTTAFLPGKTFTNETEMDEEQQMDMVGRYQSTNKAWDSLLSAVRSLLKWLHMGIAWPKDTNSEAFARRTVTASDSICSADGNVTAEDVKFNTTLPATSFGKERNATVLPGNAKREVNEPIVIFMGHSDCEELSENELSELPKFSSSPYFGLHPEIRSSNRQEGNDITFLGVMGYYGMASHKTVLEYHDTVTSLDGDEDEIQSTALGISSTEETHPKANGLALQQKDTEIGTFALMDEPQSTLLNGNHSQSSGSWLKNDHSGVCMKEREKLGQRINVLPSLTTPHQDITFLRGSTAKISRSRWMTKLVKDESTHAFYNTGLNQSGREYCPKNTSVSVDARWFIVRFWNRVLVSVGLRKPSSVPRQTAKRPQHQRLTAVPVSVFEICMTEINQTGPVQIWDAVKQVNKKPLYCNFKNFNREKNSPETLCCTKKAATRQAESESFTTKLWIKGVEFVGWIRSNETQEKAWNIANLYLTKFLTKMINWTLQDTFDMMTMILVTEYCCRALYLAIPLIINIIKRFIRLLIRKWRLYRENQRQMEEERRERLRQEELARQRAAEPKPWRPKQLRKRKANYCGRLQKW